MALLTGTQQNYYGTPSKFGNYQFVSIKDIVDQFMVAYVGEEKTISKVNRTCLLYTSPSPRDRTRSRMPSSA